MKCPICRNDNDRVIDSRTAHEGFAIRRRRECLTCNRRFTTYERVEEPELFVVKKDGGRAPYEREKIRQGIERACYKRPISGERIDAVVMAVENEFLTNYDGEIPTKSIGEIVMRHLRELDNVAFVRFASVYREFADVRDFVQELKPILAEQERRAKSKAVDAVSDEA